MRLARADGRELPWTDGAFEIVSCCLALHHFPPVEAARVLREMWRVASGGIVVTDLTRSYPAYVGTWLATRTVASNVLTRHDGPLSVLRAYTPQEMRELAAAARDRAGDRSRVSIVPSSTHRMEGRAAVA